MRKTKFKIQELCMIGLFTAIIVIMAQIAIPMPFGVPITMQTFAVMIAGIVLGSKNGALSTLIYMLLGAIGLPVFSNFTGGWQVLVGPTSGFIVTFPLMAYIIGLGTECRTCHKWTYPIGLILGNILNFLGGISIFCLLTQSPFVVGFMTCVLPFIPVTVLKTILASILGLDIKRRLQALL